jgi:hypothetical protein
LELSYSAVNPQQFVKELQLDKNDFVARMSRLKESEKQKRLAKENEQKLRRQAAKKPCLPGKKPETN